jgi:hypothetical protein
MPLNCSETLSNLTFLYAVCCMDCADTPLDRGIAFVLFCNAQLNCGKILSGLIFLCADTPLTFSETLPNLTFLYAVCWLDHADMLLNCGISLITLA